MSDYEALREFAAVKRAWPEDDRLFKELDERFRDQRQQVADALTRLGLTGQTEQAARDRLTQQAKQLADLHSRLVARKATHDAARERMYQAVEHYEELAAQPLVDPEIARQYRPKTLGVSVDNSELLAGLEAEAAAKRDAKARQILESMNADLHGQAKLLDFKKYPEVPLHPETANSGGGYGSNSGWGSGYGAGYPGGSSASAISAASLANSGVNAASAAHFSANRAAESGAHLPVLGGHLAVPGIPNPNPADPSTGSHGPGTTPDGSSDGTAPVDPRIPGYPGYPGANQPGAGNYPGPRLGEAGAVIGGAVGIGAGAAAARGAMGQGLAGAASRGVAGGTPGAMTARLTSGSLPTGPLGAGASSVSPGATMGRGLTPGATSVTGAVTSTQPGGAAAGMMPMGGAGAPGGEQRRSRSSALKAPKLREPAERQPYRGILSVTPPKRDRRRGDDDDFSADYYRAVGPGSVDTLTPAPNPDARDDRW